MGPWCLELGELAPLSQADAHTLWPGLAIGPLPGPFATVTRVFGMLTGDDTAVTGFMLLCLKQHAPWAA